MSDEVISFDMERCHMELRCPYFLENMALANLKKVFVIMFTEAWRNTEAIKRTEKNLIMLVDETKNLWRCKSKEYTDGYKTTQFDYFLTAQQKRKVEAGNKKLAAAVKSAKHKHEKILKVQSLFESFKQKYKYLLED